MDSLRLFLVVTSCPCCFCSKCLRSRVKTICGIFYWPSLSPPLTLCLCWAPVIIQSFLLCQYVRVNETPPFLKWRIACTSVSGTTNALITIAIIIFNSWLPSRSDCFPSPPFIGKTRKQILIKFGGKSGHGATSWWLDCWCASRF